MLLSTPLVAVAWVWTGRPGLVPAAAGWCALSGVLEVTYLWLLAAAYRRGELSAVYPIARGTAPLLAVFAGLGLLAGRLSALQLAGVGLLLVGILAVTLSSAAGRATVPALLTRVAIRSSTARRPVEGRRSGQPCGGGDGGSVIFWHPRAPVVR